MPQHLTNLADPLVKRVALHVFNKTRAPIEHRAADGTITFNQSKSKYTRPAETLLAQYGLDIHSNVLKNANQRPSPDQSVSCHTLSSIVIMLEVQNDH